MRSPKSLFISTFLLVFVAEIGDKTQIAAFSLAARHGAILSVIIGGALALIISTFAAVVLGKFMASRLPRNLIRIISGVMFIAAGVITLLRLFDLFSFFVCFSRFGPLTVFVRNVLGNHDKMSHLPFGIEDR